MQDRPPVVLADGGARLVRRQHVAGGARRRASIVPSNAQIPGVVAPGDQSTQTFTISSDLEYAWLALPPDPVTFAIDHEATWHDASSSLRGRRVPRCRRVLHRDLGRAQPDGRAPPGGRRRGRRTAQLTRSAGDPAGGRPTRRASWTKGLDTRLRPGAGDLAAPRARQLHVQPRRALPRRRPVAGRLPHDQEGVLPAVREPDGRDAANDRHPGAGRVRLQPGQGSGRRHVLGADGATSTAGSRCRSKATAGSGSTRRRRSETRARRRYMPNAPGAGPVCPSGTAGRGCGPNKGDQTGDPLPHGDQRTERRCDRQSGQAAGISRHSTPASGRTVPSARHRRRRRWRWLALIAGVVHPVAASRVDGVAGCMRRATHER